MIITIYNESDLKKTGGFKKRNNTKTMSKEEFIKHIKEKDLKLSKPYMDSYGLISNGNMFKINLENGLMIGVSKLIKEIEVL